MKEVSLQEVMDTTEVGETIVLKEEEENTYIRTRAGLRRISSKVLNITRINKPRRQYQ